MTKNCPHRIRTREISGCSDSWSFTGRYICVCESMVNMFGEMCEPDDHGNCYFPALTRAERIKKLIEMGQLDLAPFLKFME